jgi:hypothetical protein
MESGNGMPKCKWCGEPFLPVKDWQLFCCARHCQDWHLHQRKLAWEERLFDKLRKRDEALARLNNGELAQLVLDSRGTEEMRQRAREVLAKIEIKIPENANANGNGEVAEIRKCKGCGRDTTNERFCSPKCRMKFFNSHQDVTPSKLVRRI